MCMSSIGQELHSECQDGNAYDSLLWLYVKMALLLDTFHRHFHQLASHF